MLNHAGMKGVAQADFVDSNRVSQNDAAPNFWGSPFRFQAQGANDDQTFQTKHPSTWTFFQRRNESYRWGETSDNFIGAILGFRAMGILVGTA